MAALTTVITFCHKMRPLSRVGLPFMAWVPVGGRNLGQSDGGIKSPGGHRTRRPGFGQRPLCRQEQRERLLDRAPEVAAIAVVTRMIGGDAAEFDIAQAV